MVRFVGVPHAADQVRARWPEVVVTDVRANPVGQIADAADVLKAGRVQAWAFGSGLGTGNGSPYVVETLLEHRPAGAGRRRCHHRRRGPPRLAVAGQPAP